MSMVFFFKNTTSILITVYKRKTKIWENQYRPKGHKINWFFSVEYVLSSGNEDCLLSASSHRTMCSAIFHQSPVIKRQEKKIESNSVDRRFHAINKVENLTAHKLFSVSEDQSPTTQSPLQTRPYKPNSLPRPWCKWFWCNTLSYSTYIWRGNVTKPLLRDIEPGRKHCRDWKRKVREVLTWTVAILNCIRSVGNTAPQTDAHVAGDGRYVVSVDGAQTVLSAVAAAAAAAAAVRVVQVVLGVPWLPVLIPSVPFLTPVRL